MSGEMVTLGSLGITPQQYNQMMMMMSRPRWNTRSSPNVAAQTRDDFLSKVSVAEARDAHIAYQRSQREQVFTGSASQPVGGRAARQHKIDSARFDVQTNWSAEDEKAFVKAFGKRSPPSQPKTKIYQPQTHALNRPTGFMSLRNADAPKRPTGFVSLR